MSVTDDDSVTDVTDVTDVTSYEDFAKQAFEFIKAVEDINLAEFPQVVRRKLKSEQMTRNEYISRMKILLRSMFDTRISVLEEYFDEINSAEVLKRVNESSPSEFIVNLTDFERAYVSDKQLRTILRDNPDVAELIVIDFSQQ